MTTVISLAFAHARHHLARTLLLIGCIFVCGLVPMASRVLSHALEHSLLSRARSTPLVAGSKGSRVDLVMAALYFRRSPVDPITTATWIELTREARATVIPINACFTARGHPIVAAPPDYLEFRSLRCARGVPPALIGEVVLGEGVARATGLGPGDTIFSDQADAFDLAAPPALRMHITGVLERRGSADDDALFTDLKTAWVLAGLSHGHADAASKVPEPLVLERSAGRVVVSEELVDYNEVTPENVTTFHLHADPGSLPLTAIIIAPESERELSLIKARLNARGGLQALVPEQAVREVLAIVARFEQAIRMLSTLMAALTCITIGLVTALSARIRARERETLGKLGASRVAVSLLFGVETAAQILIGVMLAGLATGLLWIMPPDLVKVL